MLTYNLAYIYFIFTHQTTFPPSPHHLSNTFRKKRSRSQRMPRLNCRRNWNKKWRKIEKRNKRRQKASEASNPKNDLLFFPVAGNGATQKTPWMKRWLRRLFHRRPSLLWVQRWGTLRFNSSFNYVAHFCISAVAIVFHFLMFILSLFMQPSTIKKNLLRESGFEFWWKVNFPHYHVTIWLLAFNDRSWNSFYF